MIVGFALGLIRMGIDTPVKLLHDFKYTEGSFLWIINNIFFQYYSLIIFIVCIIVMVVVSYLTAPPSYEKINGLTYGTTTAEDREKSRSSWTKGDLIFSIALVAIIVAIYIYFTG